MSAPTQDILVWLRSTIQGDQAAAEKASPGPWVNAGQAGVDDAWQIHGAPTEETGTWWDDDAQDMLPVPSRVATLNYEDGGGVWRREDADHIVTHQPRDAIARCSAELAIIKRYTEIKRIADQNERRRSEHNYAADTAAALLDAIEWLVQGYRHRPGYGSWEAS